ncbi:MFS transporter [Chryseobacterium nematophagum]|uniref:MFS transporter n=2 Tax=Chryseobacterium nematophagum TaxID=2305228 RepID=A0A3M7LCG8_9FLAO|nr:MFS transporter [Chryseobacterium nematophagum]RMZ59919.1 MFS transporter [Chryseobacterium nematophagum]
MGIIILQLSDNQVPYQKLGFLESFKDLPIAFISLFAVHIIHKTGIKKALIAALSVVGICSSILPFVDVFWFYKVWFVIIGTCFAIGKICVFGIMRNNISNEKSLAKTMNSVEASFMIGIFLVNIIFGWLITSEYEKFWKFGFFLISILSGITIFLFSKLTLSESKKYHETGMISALTSFLNPLVILFLCIIFFIVFIEQSLNTWLPSFYRTHLKVDTFFAIQASSCLALFYYFGRMITAYKIQKFSLSNYYIFCILLIITILAIIIGIQHLKVIPSLNLYLFPLIGLFLSPLYPLINSKMIATIDKEKITLFTSLIVIFSSLGSSTSSIIISLLFEKQILTFYSLYILCAVFVLLLISLLYFTMLRRRFIK